MAENRSLSFTHMELNIAGPNYWWPCCVDSEESWFPWSWAPRSPTQGFQGRVFIVSDIWEGNRECRSPPASSLPGLGSDTESFCSTSSGENTHVPPLKWSRMGNSVPGSLLLSCDASLLWKGNQNTWGGIEWSLLYSVFQFCEALLLTSLPWYFWGHWQVIGNIAIAVR